MKVSTVAKGLSFVLVAGLTVAHAADFSGKNINLIIGFGAGGGYDTNGRLFARHYGKHLPGKPNVVAQNQPGGGGLRAANYIYNAAPKDGTAIGLFPTSSALEPVLGNAAASFETLKFTWIGNLHKDVTACGAWASSGIRSFEDMKHRTTRFGGAGPAAITTQHPYVLKNMLGLDIEVVQGYRGTKDINLAMARGEVDASCAMFASNLRGPYASSLASGDLRMIVQMGRENRSEFGDAVNIYSLLQTEEDKQVADFIFKQIEIARPIAGPPGLQSDVTAALREGFDAVVKDAAFLSDAKKMGLDFDPMSAAELIATLEVFVSAPPSLIARAQKVSSP